LKRLLPIDCKILEKWIEALPLKEASAVHPFGGFVININVATSGHRDWMDKLICMVLVISDCEGGELVLYEPGLVLDLRSGDMAVFPSDDITHFNLHFKGKRISLVFHTDKTAVKWEEDRNAWVTHQNFVTS
jgi:predicted 2-oxoglutarate/Fe(II)-dependent dioxygenase YbiX